MRLKLTARTHVAKGIKIPEWGPDLWAEIISTFHTSRSVLKRDLETNDQCRIYVEAFLKNEGIDIPLKSILLKLADDWGGHANYREKLIMINAGPEFLERLEKDGTARAFEPLRGTFYHELGHILDKSIQYNKPKKLKYPSNPSEDPSGVQHAKFPTEWRAYAMEIQSQLFSNPRVRPFGLNYEDVDEYLAAYSSEWRYRKEVLPDAGKKYILGLFGAILLKDPAHFTGDARTNPDFISVLPFKTLGQFIMVAKAVQDSPQFPFQNFFMDQLWDAASEFPNPLETDVDWLNGRREMIPEVYGREYPARELNPWIKQLNKIIAGTPATDNVGYCEPFEKYVVGLYFEAVEKKYPGVLQEPYIPLPDAFNSGLELIHFTDAFCSKNRVGYWQLPLERAFKERRTELREAAQLEQAG